METRKVIAITISILVVIGAVGGMLVLNSSRPEPTTKAVAGMFELPDGWMEDQEVIELDGEWEFYPGVLIEPGSPFDAHRSIRTYIEVPGSWDSAQPHGGPSGSGTYRLMISIPDQGLFGIRTDTIRTSARIYVNGIEGASIGSPSTDYESYALGSRRQNIYTSSESREVELVIHVSSYDYRAGGIIKPIQFGSADAIEKMVDRSRTMDGTVIVICLAFAVHSFFSWLQRRSDLYLLHAAVAGLFMSLYLSTYGEQLLTVVYHYDYYTRLRIQIFSMPLVALHLLLFAKNLLPDYGNRTLIRINSWYLAASMLFVFNNTRIVPFIPFGVAQVCIGLGIVVTFINIFWMMFRSMGSEADSSVYLIVTFSSLFSYWLVMVMKMFFEMQTGPIPDILIVGTALSVSLLAGDRLQADRRRAEALSG